MDHEHPHPRNPNPCDTHDSENFAMLSEFEFSDVLLLDDGPEEVFLTEKMTSSNMDIDGFISSGASSLTHSNMKCKDGATKSKADQAGSCRVAFRTKSDLEVMDDGFKWRKYGKKMVKSSPNPRNYYKCASGGCNVKKRVERDGEDSSYVITTYDGVHNHESPCVVYYNQTPLMVPNGWTLQPPSPTSNYNQEGALSVEELVDEESLNEVTQSFYLLGELEETPSDPRESGELKCDPMEVTPTIISHHFSILHVLDLPYTEIKSLPQSISRLVALQKLFLRSCELLMELPPEIGELANLEVLDLEGTEILRLPKEIAKLVNLTCLKVSFYGYANQTVIPRRVLSNLSSLIELIIDVTPFGEWWDVEVEAIVDDLCSLKELRTLQLYLPTAEPLEELTLRFPGLANFRFTVGHHKEHFISRLPNDVKEEFDNREKLEKGLKYLFSIHGFSQTTMPVESLVSNLWMVVFFQPNHS